MILSYRVKYYSLLFSMENSPLDRAGVGKSDVLHWKKMTVAFIDRPEVIFLYKGAAHLELKCQILL